MFAKRVEKLRPSPTIAVATKAKQMILSGIDVFDLSLGDPALDPTYQIPRSIKDFAIEAIEHGKISYTPSAGLEEVRNCVVKKLQRDNGLIYSADEISIANGAKQIIFNAFLATIDKDDEVILPCPCWVSYADMVEIFGGVPVKVPTSVESGFKITPEQLEQAITPKTKWLVINSPCNPTGAVYSKEELEKLSHILCKNKRILIMSDDIYEYLLFGENKFYNIPMVEPSLRERTIMVNGTAKSHAMTGWRIGYGVGNKEFIKKLNALQSQSTSNACTISQYAMIPATEDGNKTSSLFIPQLLERANMVVNALNNNGFFTQVPSGAFYIWASVEKFIGASYNGTVIDSCETFAQMLLENGHVATIPSTAFGAKGYIRFSLGSSYERLELAMKNITKFVEKVSMKD